VGPARRPGRDRAPEILQLVARSFRHQLDRAVTVVAHPAGEPELMSFALDEVAKADALHVSVHRRMEPLHHVIDVSNYTLSPSGRGMWERGLSFHECQ